MFVNDMVRGKGCDISPTNKNCWVGRWMFMISKWYIDGNLQPRHEVADKFLIEPHPFSHTENVIKWWSSLHFSYQNQILFLLRNM